MRHAKRKPKLGRTTSHREAMLGNLVTSLFKHQQVRTTQTKAKAARRLADQMITLGKRGDLSARRQSYSVLKDRTIVKTLFHEVAPLYKDRQGGYTRVLRLSHRRRGDGAPMAILELVEKRAIEEVAPKKSKEVKPEKGAQVQIPEETQKKAGAKTEAPITSKETVQKPEATSKKPQGPKSHRADQKFPKGKKRGGPGLFGQIRKIFRRKGV
jgi:large subunit ribosomal protein L17